MRLFCFPGNRLLWSSLTSLFPHLSCTSTQVTGSFSSALPADVIRQFILFFSDYCDTRRNEMMEHESEKRRMFLKKISEMLGPFARPSVQMYHADTSSRTERRARAAPLFILLIVSAVAKENPIYGSIICELDETT